MLSSKHLLNNKGNITIFLVILSGIIFLTIAIVYQKQLSNHKTVVKLLNKSYLAMSATNHVSVYFSNLSTCSTLLKNITEGSDKKLAENFKSKTSSKVINRFLEKYKISDLFFVKWDITEKYFILGAVSSLKSVSKIKMYYNLDNKNNISCSSTLSEVPHEKNEQ